MFITLLSKLETLSNKDSINLKTEVCLNLKHLFNDLIDIQTLINLNVKFLEENNSKIRICSIDNIITLGKSGASKIKHKSFILQILTTIKNDDTKEVKTYLLENFCEILKLYLEVSEVRDQLGEIFIKLINDTDKEINILLISKLFDVIKVLASLSSSENMPGDINTNEEDLLENILKELAKFMGENVLIIVKSKNC